MEVQYNPQVPSMILQTVFTNERSISRRTPVMIDIKFLRNWVFFLRKETYDLGDCQGIRFNLWIRVVTIFSVKTVLCTRTVFRIKYPISILPEWYISRGSWCWKERMMQECGGIFLQSNGPTADWTGGKDHRAPRAFGPPAKRACQSGASGAARLRAGPNAHTRERISASNVAHICLGSDHWHREGAGAGWQRAEVCCVPRGGCFQANRGTFTLHTVERSMDRGELSAKSTIPYLGC